MILIVYEKHTKEVIAYIDLNGETQSFLKSNVCVDVYNKSAPVFIEKGDKLIVKQKKLL